MHVDINNNVYICIFTGILILLKLKFCQTSAIIFSIIFKYFNMILQFDFLGKSDIYIFTRVS